MGVLARGGIANALHRFEIMRRRNTAGAMPLVVASIAKSDTARSLH